MNNLMQMRIDVKRAALEWAGSLLSSGQVPAWMLIDALNSVLLQLKDQEQLELMQEAALNLQQALAEKEEVANERESVSDLQLGDE